MSTLTENAINPGSGLTPEEQRAVSLLVSAWNQFVSLPGFDADDRSDFRRAIHEAERIIASHALARVLPEYWR